MLSKIFGSICNHLRLVNTEGRILPGLANAIAAFRHAPEWGGVLAFNEFGFGTVALKPTPWGVVPKGEWTDHDDRLAAEWLQKQGILVSVEVAGQAVQTAARDRPFHPVKTYVQSLRWDGVERVDHWLSTYLGGEDTGYSHAVGAAMPPRTAGILAGDSGRYSTQSTS